MTFDIGYGDVGYPVVLQVSMQDKVCGCCRGGGGLEDLLKDTVNFLFSNTSSLLICSELLQTFCRASAFEENPYVHTDGGFHLQLPVD